MVIYISSVALLLFFVYIIIAERKCAKRSKDFFKKADVRIADLSQRAQARYEAKFGHVPGPLDGGWKHASSPRK